MKRLEVPKLFVDETSTRILLATLNRSRSGLEISRATGIPVAETFARLRFLRKKELVCIDGHEISARGTATPMYRSTFNEAYLFVEKGRIKVRFALTSYGTTDVRGEMAASL